MPTQPPATHLLDFFSGRVVLPARDHWRSPSAGATPQPLSAADMMINPNVVSHCSLCLRLLPGSTCPNPHTQRSPIPAPTLVRLPACTLAAALSLAPSPCARRAPQARRHTPRGALRAPLASPPPPAGGEGGVGLWRGCAPQPPRPEAAAARMALCTGQPGQGGGRGLSSRLQSTG
jgi:hypothetical protein